MDFEQIKNQYINKGRQALNYIRDLPKISESIGIPYAKEINQFVDKGIQGGFQKGLSGGVEMAQLYAPTVGTRLKTGLITSFTTEKDLETGANFKNDPMYQNFENSIKEYSKEIETGKSSILGRNLSSEEIDRRKELLDRVTKQRDSLFEERKKQNERLLQELKSSRELEKQTAEKAKEIIKKYNAEDIYTPEGALTRLGGAVPDLAGTYGVTAGLAIATRGRSLVPTIGGAIFTGLTTKGSLYNDAINEGATPEQANKASNIGAALSGAISFIPLDSFLNNITSKKLVQESLKKNIIKEAVKVLKSAPAKVVRQAGSEGFEEYLQTIAENASKLTYKEYKGLGQLTEGASEAAFVGAIGGGLVGGISSPLNIETDKEEETQTFESKKNIKDLSEKYKSITDINAEIVKLELALRSKFDSSGKSIKITPEKNKEITEKINELKAARLYKSAAQQCLS